MTVLRLLTTERPSAHGGAVTYLAEVDRTSLDQATTATLEPWAGDLTDDPQRMPWAMPGGPAADLAWAADAISARGMALTGPPEQIRSWNLSSLWRLPTAGGDAWLKVVPPFFAHEGAILEALAGGPVPTLLAHDGARVLLAGIPGDDQYDARLPSLHAMVDILVGIQMAWLDRTDALFALGLPDWRATSLTEAIADLVARSGHRVSTDDRTALAAFVDGLPARFERIADCGLGDGLVHGDCHPGNVRGDGPDLVLLDWGDCGVGHPLLDMPGFLDRIAAEHVAPVRDRWLARWRSVVPARRPNGPRPSSPRSRPHGKPSSIDAFLDGIEPSEHPYHQADVPDWLGRTAALARAEHSQARR